MSKNDFTKNVAKRIQSAMKDAQLTSSRSPYGVDVEKLAAITGNSPQICRRYLRGDALPTAITIMTIAAEINVTPGWLLFGDNQKPLNKDDIFLNKETLKHLFLSASKLYKSKIDTDEIPGFLIDLIEQVSDLQLNHTDATRTIDIAINSACRFK